MPRPHDLPLVGPGSELQLTIDGRAVPHHEVVASRVARVASAADERPERPAPGDPGVAPGQISLSAD